MDNRMMNVVNPTQDPSSPYYMPPSENPGAILVSNILNGDNYHSWSRAMAMSLKSKNKLFFIDGSLPKPLVDDPMFTLWDKCNTLVVSWLIQSMDASIAQSVMWMETTMEIWQDLRERYYQGDIFRISELLGEIHSYKQGNLSVGSYYTHIKGLWQELDNFRPIPSYACTNKNECGLATIIKTYRENDYVICFLKGLNDQYEAVRSQIMLMDPLPSINKAFSLLTQQERHLNMHMTEPRVLVSTADQTNNAYNSQLSTNSYVSNRGRIRGRGNQGQFSRNSYVQGRGNNILGKYTGGRGTKICTFCHKTGNTVDHCYKKHGFPLVIKGM
ncbi:putative gag-polypeptide of LTR copia-type [Lupinus albus]|uniref:Putative gag-polypeptide of LTR copia-type n=1 Tax=Lupinus albus TaxID=3870 RepID=A0A6A4P398_LUPAL|nr:putative gag-polypeptide of LTR copia-type [Lupinus albus]